MLSEGIGAFPVSLCASDGNFRRERAKRRIRCSSLVPPLVGEVQQAGTIKGGKRLKKATGS